MSSRRKLSSISAIVVLLAALLGWLTHAPQRQGHISLPPAQRNAPVTAGLARITKIVDGDTVHALFSAENGAALREEKVRLYGINAPELHPRPGQSRSEFTVQPYAQEANDFLEKLCPLGSEVKIEEHGRDRYDRLLGVLILPDGRDVNKLLIEAGLVRVYFLKTQKNDPLRNGYEQAQENAQAAHKGLWK